MTVLLTTKRDPKTDPPEPYTTVLVYVSRPFSLYGTGYLCERGTWFMDDMMSDKLLEDEDPSIIDWWAELPKPTSRADLLRAIHPDLTEADMEYAALGATIDASDHLRDAKHWTDVGEAREALERYKWADEADARAKRFQPPEEAQP